MTDGSVSLGGTQQLGVQQLKSTKSRNQILDAAIDVLVSKGYAQASTLAIQEAAGVSRGRLLHHFPSRDDLLMAAVHHLARVRIEELPQRVEWPDDPIERISVGIDTGWSTFHQPYFVASIELWTAARTNERLRSALLPAERELGPTVRTAVDSFLGPVLTAAPRTDELYPILLSSMRGAAMTYLLDRRDPRDDPHLPLWKALTAEYLLED
ncbi:TetR/AcrR family transcriptional regulator [Williamsia soli]|uniref:TetR/AcrR family transcriptional regulator n=1 Tax=Williamsia soli TaxID=364929 RepID=UPI001A9DF156|nr:TetR/AcrR family transcriptional regulator [Williamsia soli]